MAVYDILTGVENVVGPFSNVSKCKDGQLLTIDSRVRSVAYNGIRLTAFCVYAMKREKSCCLTMLCNQSSFYCHTTCRYLAVSLLSCI